MEIDVGRSLESHLSETSCEIVTIPVTLNAVKDLRFSIVTDCLEFLPGVWQYFADATVKNDVFL